MTTTTEAPTIPEHASRYAGSGRIPRRRALLWEELSERQREHVRRRAIPNCHPSNIPADVEGATWGVEEADPGSLNMSIEEGGRTRELRARIRAAERAAKAARS
jgi:hypothetical protein